MGSHKLKSAPSVEDFMSHAPQPLRAEMEALRQLVLSASPGIGEEVKWNAPSFHLGEHFATMRLNGKVPLQLILHRGAKKSELPPPAIDDPTGLLEWLGPDRACVNFTKPGAVSARADALKAILQQWVNYIPPRTVG